MSLKMGDVKGGLAILKKVTPGNVNYIEAKKKASINLFRRIKR